MNKIRLAKGEPCAICGTGASVVYCDGCDKPLCEECRIFDIWCTGCGSGESHVFCRACNDNPEINMWKGL
jgi:hypothetical protein